MQIEQAPLHCSRLSLSFHKIGCGSAMQIEQAPLHCSRLSLSLQSDSINVMEEATGTDINTLEILHPEVWSLAIRISSGNLSYAIHSRMEDNSLVYGNITLTENASGIKKIETAIYDNRFFLYEYERRTILLESPHFLIVPDEFSAENRQEECERYYRYLYPDDKYIIRTDHIDNSAVTMAYGISQELDSFLRRTFDNPPIMHSLTPIVQFFKKRDSFGSTNKMYAYLYNGTVEILGIRSNKIVFANFFKFTEINDAFYYIMNVWHTIGFDCANDEMHILGEKQYRKTLLAELRRYIRNVIQSIFPAQLLRLGKNAMNAPFDLIILPLCE